MKEIRLTADILSRPWASNPGALKVFLQLLFMADKNGEILISERALARLVNVGYQVVRTALSNAKLTQDLTQEVTQKQRKITICNYDSYTILENKPNAIPNALPNANPTQQEDIYKNSNLPFILNNNFITREEKKKNKKIETEKEKEKGDINIPQKEREKEKTEEQKKEEILVALVESAKSKLCPFSLDKIPVELQEDFNAFLQMRKQIRKPIRTQQAINARWNELQRLSGGNTELAKQIIRQSIDNEWQAFYALKETKKEIQKEVYKNDKYW